MRLVTLLVFVVVFSFTASAQYSKTQDSTDAPKIRAKVVYGELLGSGLIFSGHYDFRFGKKQNGWGMRAGLGFFGGSGGGLFTVPVGINHLVGKGPHYFESGLGLTLVSFAGDADFLVGGGSLLFPSAGYRYQPLGKGLVARVYVGPLVGIGEELGWFFWGGFSLGYKLR